MRDPIKDMYKTVFDDYTVNKDGGEWEAMESRIQKQNFLHFRWAQFNIYYAVSIIITLFLSSAMAGHYFYSNYMKKGSVRNAEIVQHIQENKTIVISETTTKTSPEERAEVKISEVTSVSADQKQNKTSASSSSQTQHEESIAKPENKISEQDLNFSENIPAESAKDPFIKVQKVVIVKQDTIHKVDTIKTKGRFWKRH
ncbi:hypothetical protein [Sporocytophaga myxococcoides]|nr:hypothetical protein [Sporocytophaga myxococcoides]